MDKETLLNTLKEIGTIEDDVKRRDLIADITNEVATIYDKETTLEEENNKYKEDMETLRQANMKLFLRVGADKTPSEIKIDKTGEDDTQPRKFEDLFDDKGNLK